MADFPSREDLRRIYEVAVLHPPPGTPRPNITRAALETPGTDANAMREGAAAVGDEVAGSLTEAVAGWFLDSAQAEQLDRRVLDLVGLKRKDAAAAPVRAVSSDDSARGRATDSEGNAAVNPDGIEFLTTTEAVLPAASVGPLSVTVRSKRADSGALAPPNTITAIKSDIPNAPDDLVVTNELATSTGDDVESDRSLRAAYENFWKTAQRALAALEEAATRVEGVVSAKALEYYDAFGRQTKQVLLAITDRYTSQYVQQNVVPPAYAARSQALADFVKTALRTTRAAGIYVGVFVAEVIQQPVQLVLTFTAGANPFEVAEAARAAAVNYVNDLAPGAAFRRADCVRALRRVPGLVITGNEVFFPPGDVVPSVLQKLGTDLSSVTANSSAVDRPLPTLYSSDGYVVGG